MKVDLILLMKIHECIAREKTGSPEYFASKFGISKRFLHNILEYFKTEFDAPIAYSKSRKTYYYKEEWDFYIGDLKRIRSELIKGILETIRTTVRILIVVNFILL